MIETVMKVEGMACGMCEAHVNDAVRAAVQVKRVTSSYKKGETVLLTETPPDEAALRAAVEQTGYRVTEVHSAPYVRRGFFRR